MCQSLLGVTGLNEILLLATNARHSPPPLLRLSSTSCCQVSPSRRGLIDVYESEVKETLYKSHRTVQQLFMAKKISL